MSVRTDMTTCLNCGHQDESGFLFCPLCGTKAPEVADPTDSLLGKTLNQKYRIVTEIGAGAMGTVYLGEHIGLKKKIALKVLHPDLQLADESLQRFQREGIAAGKFSHPNAIQVFDFDKGEGDTFYLAMEFVEGSNLKVFLRRHGRFSVPETIRLIRQLLSVLAEAHKHGIVHRDLKPDNIMVETGSRGELRIKVLDFGLSKLIDRRLDAGLQTQVGRIMGTPLYMSPEQCAGDEADERSDLYAAGLILYEMLAGTRPFQDESTTELILTRTTKEAPSLILDHPDIDIPDELDLFIHKCLERRREDRFQSADEMLVALDDVPYLGEGAATTTSATRSQLAIERHRQTVRDAQVPVPPRGAPKKALLVAVLGVLITAAVGMGVLAIFIFPGMIKGSLQPEAPPLVSEVPPAERTTVQASYVTFLESTRASLRAGDVSSAWRSVEQALALECRDAEAFLVRADVYRARGDYDTALADLREALRMDPGYAEALLAMGWIQFDQGNLEAASETFAEVETEGNGRGEVLGAQGAIAYRQGNTKRARELLDDAIEAAPGSAVAPLYLGRLLLDEDDVPGAIEVLVQAKRNDPGSGQVYAWLAEAYLRDESYDQAESQLREALSRGTDTAEVREGLGALLVDRGRFPEARDFLDESAARYPSSGRLRILHGVALEEARQTVEAIVELEKGLRLEPDDLEARLLLGVLYHRSGRLDDAVREYQAVLQVDDDLATAHYDLGLALFELERFEEAADSFELALLLDPDDANVHFHLGLLHKDYLGDPDRAADHFQQYLNLGGNDRRVSAWLRSIQR